MFLDQCLLMGCFLVDEESRLEWLSEENLQNTLDSTQEVDGELGSLIFWAWSLVRFCMLPKKLLGA